MGKKVKEYKSGDFIFAKVKGYPAWPARVQKLNGKKYFVYFYGTGETANLSPNMIFDYVENKDKFLTKSVKRRDFNDGVKQIEHDFANNVPLEDVIGVPVEAPADTSADDTAYESTANDTMDETGADTTAGDETTADDSIANASQNNAAVEDSDETGALIIDEGKKGRKSKADSKAKETPSKPAKEAKTPRGKVKKDEAKKDDSKEDEEEKREEEVVSRSGRKIRPKRYIDEQSDDNATPTAKKRRGSPAPEKEKEKEKDKEKEKEKTETKDKVPDKSFNQFNIFTQSELEGLKEPFKSVDTEKENILMAYLPTSNYVGIKLFRGRPSTFKNEAARLQWDKQAASNAITLKFQLERGHITPQSVITQLVTDLCLTDEEKATLNKERETDEKRSRVQFLKTEMKLIELDAKIKTCLCLEKADTELCLKLLDELMELEVKPLMLLKHPTCLETIKRMRAYVGNTPSWELSESAALIFSKQAHKIRKQADTLYRNMKELFFTPEGLSFWEMFTERVLQFKKLTSALTADELLELVNEPLELSLPAAHTMKAAVDAAKDGEPQAEEQTPKKKTTAAKTRKSSNSTPSKSIKRQTSRKQEEKEKETEKERENEKETEKEKEKDKEQSPKPNEDVESSAVNDKSDAEEKTPDKNQKKDEKSTQETSKEVTKDVEPATEEKKSNAKENSEATASKAKDKTPEREEPKEMEKQEMGEPRAKRSRENKKTDPPTRSPTKRKSKC